jgi:hypothetical protein
LFVITARTRRPGARIAIPLAAAERSTGVLVLPRIAALRFTGAARLGGTAFGTSTLVGVELGTGSRLARARTTASGPAELGEFAAGTGGRRRGFARSAAATNRRFTA